MGWDGMGWDGMGWDGMGWDGMGWDGMGWDGMGCFCFVLFCEKRFGQGRTGPLPEITHLLFGGALPLPLYYPCPPPFFFPENFHVFLNLYCQRKQNNLPLACTGRYLFWFFSCLSGRCCFCCGLIVAPVFV